MQAECRQDSQQLRMRAAAAAYVNHNCITVSWDDGLFKHMFF